MELGIFEWIFDRPSLAEQLEAVAKAGFGCVQFHLERAGVDPWQGALAAEDVNRVASTIAASGIRVAALSGTYNMSHPDEDVRRAGHLGLSRAIAAASALGTDLVTLCTGTRDRSSMWRWHPDNETDASWDVMVESVNAALEVASLHGVTLVIEPEPANVVSSARMARRLLDQLGNDRHLKIVLDPANIVLSDRSRTPEAVLTESFELLGPDIVFAHAKDLDASGRFCAVGTGIVPWSTYRDLLAGIDYRGALVFHTLEEQDIPVALAAAGFV